MSEPAGRIVTPQRMPRICACPYPVPHRHANGDHWCTECGGYLGNPALDGFPARCRESCACPPCPEVEQ